MRPGIAVICLCLAALLAGGQAKGERAVSHGIDVYAENPHYWACDGRPVLLLGGSVEDNLFQIRDLERELDTLTAAGGNYLRCTMSSRDEGNVRPFARKGDKYDLDAWNPEYWRRFEVFLQETAKRGIVIQIEVWATFDYYREEWDENPFNPKNNVNYTAEESGLPTEVPTHPVETGNNFFWTVPAENDREVVLKYQRRFVDQILAHTLRCDHVLYCMDNETSVTPAWGEYWARYVRQAAEKAGKRVHTTEMWDPWDLTHPMHAATIEHPEVYTFVEVSQNNHQKGQAHYDHLVAARRRLADSPRPMTSVKVYGADSGRFGTSKDGVERFWRNIFAGLSAVRFHRPDAGLGLTARAQRMIASAREVTGAFDIFSCEPRPDLLSDRAENEAYCLARPPDEYALYFPDGGKVALKTGGKPLTLRWYDIENGKWTQSASVSGEEVRLTAPGQGQWAAVLRAK